MVQWIKKKNPQFLIPKLSTISGKITEKLSHNKNISYEIASYMEDIMTIPVVLRAFC